MLSFLALASGWGTTPPTKQNKLHEAEKEDEDEACSVTEWEGETKTGKDMQ